MLFASQQKSGNKHGCQQNQTSQASDPAVQQNRTPGSDIPTRSYQRAANRNWQHPLSRNANCRQHDGGPHQLQKRIAGRIAREQPNVGHNKSDQDEIRTTAERGKQPLGKARPINSSEIQRDSMSGIDPDCRRICRVKTHQAQTDKYRHRENRERE